MQKDSSPLRKVETLCSVFHRAFDADLSVDGILCYSNGARVANPLRLKPLKPEETKCDWVRPEDFLAYDKQFPMFHFHSPSDSEILFTDH
jgi:hypothetical protein